MNILITLPLHSFRKKSMVTELKDFRLINLLSSVYKTISKILSIRLKVMLKNIISPPHGAFIEGDKSWMRF